jgi:hypothetical protein
MVDLMEREADHATQEAVITREAIQEEEQRIAQEREQIRQEEQQLAQERQQPGADQEALDQRQQALDQQQEALQQRTEILTEQRQEAERQEEFAEQRTTVAQQERQQIAQDQQAMIDNEPPPGLAQGILGVSILNPNSSLGRIVLLDNMGQVIRQSPLNTVHTRTVTIINDRVFAIAGENRGAGAIRLVEINSDTLEMQRQGDNDITPESMLWLNGQDMYAIVGSAGDLNLARFNTDLVLQSRSSVNVHPLASVFYYDGFLLTQRSDGSATVLNPRDLSERR